MTEARGADVVDAGRVQAWVVGPGLGTDDEAAETVRAVLAHGRAGARRRRRADGLRAAPGVAAPRPRRPCSPPTTASSTASASRSGADRLGGRAGALAARLGVHVLLKGAATVVAGPDGPARVNRTGTPGAGHGRHRRRAVRRRAARCWRRGCPCWRPRPAAACLHGRAGRAVRRTGLAIEREPGVLGGVARRRPRAVRGLRRHERDA